jgi:photosystem II stability/assembly factor-like uncharacterized protein
LHIKKKMKKIFIGLITSIILFGCDDSDKTAVNSSVSHEKSAHVYPRCSNRAQQKNQQYRCSDLADASAIITESSDAPLRLDIRQGNHQASALLFRKGGTFSNIAVTPSGSLFAAGGAGLQISAKHAAQEEWNTRFYSRFSNRFRDIEFIDDQLGFAVGYRDDIFRTQDAGLSWERFNKIALTPADKPFGDIMSYLDDELYSLKFDAEMYSITFNQRGYGVIVGEHGLLQSEDGGQTWQRVATELPKFHALQEATFADENHGWIVGTPNIVLHSSDAGKHWQRIDLDREGFNVHFMSVSFSSQAYGCIAGNAKTTVFANNRSIKGGPRVFCTKDAGATWQRSNVVIPDGKESGWLTRLVMKNPTEGWMVSTAGIIFNTVDGGDNWQIWLDITELDNDSLTDAAFWGVTLSEDRGWAVGFAEVEHDLSIKRQLGYGESFNDRKIQSPIIISWSLSDSTHIAQ